MSAPALGPSGPNFADLQDLERYVLRCGSAAMSFRGASSSSNCSSADQDSPSKQAGTPELEESLVDHNVFGSEQATCITVFEALGLGFSLSLA